MSELVKMKSGTPILAKSWDEARKVGEDLARSCMFGIQTPEQGMVVLATCQAEAMSLFQFMRTYHVVEGRPSMRSDAMLARFREKGGRYKVIENSATRAAAEFHYEGQVITREFTWDDAVKAELVKDKKGGVKDNWRKSPADMLWARMTSKAVRVLCPEVVAGAYSAEETADFTESDVDIETLNSDGAVPVQATTVPEPEPEPAEDDLAPQHELDAFAKLMEDPCWGEKNKVGAAAFIASRPTRGALKAKAEMAKTYMDKLQTNAEPHPISAEDQAKFMQLLVDLGASAEKQAEARSWLDGRPSVAEFAAKTKLVSGKLQAKKDAAYAERVAQQEAAGAEPPRTDTDKDDVVKQPEPPPPPADVEPVHSFPALGNRLDGTPFADVEPKYLEAFLKSKSPLATAAHKAGARLALAAKQEATVTS